MNINHYIKNIPKPTLVIGVLLITLIFFVLSNPLKDECEIKISSFDKSMYGILTSVQGADKKIKYAQIEYWKNNCKTGNSIGACNDYFKALRKVGDNLRYLPEKCLIEFTEGHENLAKEVMAGLKTMALVAWGDRPPVSIQTRAGWLNEADVRTFCRLKLFIENTHETEDVKLLINQIYQEFPDAWPEAIALEDRNPEIRPRALKSAVNPQGSLTSREVFERSLFSYRCDMYQ